MTTALIVDDLKENLYLLEALLKGYGYQVQTAANGAEALVQANRDLPDIIVSDILMPVMDGFTFCTQCKSDARLKKIPFIFYTATYIDHKDEEFALSLGADAFFLKPIEPIELINKISEVVSRHAAKMEGNNEENEVAPEVNLKEYNEILIHKLENKMAQLDITNKELLESENRFRRLAEKSPVLIYRFSLPEKRVTYINPIAIELTGYAPEAFYHDPMLIYDYLLPPDWQNHFDEQLNRILDGLSLPYYEYQIHHQSGETKWVQLRVVIVDDETSQPASIEGILIDQTQACLSKQALQESEGRFRSIIERTEAGYFSIDVDGFFRDVNPAWLKLYGYTSAEEILGRHYSEVQLVDDLDHFNKIVHGILLDDPRYLSGEFSRKCKDGSIGFHTFSAKPVSRFGKLIGFEGFIIDTTARRLAENEIHNLNADLEKRVQQRTAQLEAANQELEAFSYSVSHDLRAPLRGIEGWRLAFIEDYNDQLDEKGRMYLERVRTETRRMAQLIDDLLHLSRVTRAEMLIGPVNLSDLAQTIVTRLQTAEPERQVEVVIQSGLTAMGDTALLSIVLTNLLDNAWKFTGKRSQGRIEFGQMAVEDRSVFYVRDNGAGFNMVYVQKLFGAFQRLHKASEFSGTGIGLATVQRIIRRHGGEVWAEAQVDRGAAFFFTLGGK